MHVPAVDLAAPAVAHFNLAVSSGCSVPDHEMIRETILHPAHAPMIIIKHARVPLARPAIVHHNELPAASFHRRASDCLDNGPRQIPVVPRAARPGPETSFRWRCRRRLETLVLFETRLFDHNLSAVAAWSTRNSLFGRRRWRRRRSRVFCYGSALLRMGGRRFLRLWRFLFVSRRFGLPTLFWFARSFPGFL